MDDLAPLGRQELQSDDSRGSVYETSSEEPSHNRKLSKTRLSRPSTRSRPGAKSISERSKEATLPPQNSMTCSKNKPMLKSYSVHRSPSADRQIREGVATSPVRSQGPTTVDAIEPLPRRVTSKKRKAARSASEARARRLRSFYSNGYRELLNHDMNSGPEKSSGEVYLSLERSLIGSTLWSANEKETLFSALPPLGKTNVRAIARRIGSKSELEVRDYIRLLDRGLRDHVSRDHHGQLGFTDSPASFEISGECCGILEKAGDAVASRQESAEEKAEYAKWGEQWLLTAEMAENIDQQIIEGGSENAIAENLSPAVHLFHLKTWLELSEKVFMNPGAPREHENWQLLSEVGEVPAIRATAFGDFHSLAVAITKRLVSTALYSRMSRQRVMGLHQSKNAEVSIADVHAAITILGLERNCKDFWTRCPRKCSLQVYDSDQSTGTGDCTVLCYEEVEWILHGENISQSRSRSTSQQSHASAPKGKGHVVDLSLESQSSHDDAVGIAFQSSSVSGNKSVSDSDIYDVENSDHSNVAIMDHISSSRWSIDDKQTAEEMEQAQDDFTEAFDKAASNEEERRLWIILLQQIPVDLKREPPATPGPVKRLPEQSKATSILYHEPLCWSEWEMIPRPILSETFLRDRRWRTQQAGRQPSLTSKGNRSSTSEEESSGELSLQAENLGKGMHHDGSDKSKEKAAISLPAGSGNRELMVGGSSSAGGHESQKRSANLKLEDSD